VLGSIERGFGVGLLRAKTEMPIILPADPHAPPMKTLPRAARLGLVPLVFYLVSFLVLTYPAVRVFSTHYYADSGDGMQNEWNIWWVKKAVTQLHQSPWHTNYLHYPFGVSLLAHTLNPFNGFLGITLSQFMSPVAVYNVIVVFSFVVGGLTAFFLAYYLTGSYWASMIAGFIFTFSPYHFAHAQGHLQLVSLEWIPLFLLLWLKLLEVPTPRLAVSAAVVLFLVILCDYYYFFYCVVAGIIITCWQLWQHRDPLLLFRRHYLLPVAGFVLVSLSTSGILAGALLLSTRHSPMVGAHPAGDYSLDLLAPFIYGGHWRFGNLTRGYWSRLPGNIEESSVYLGFSVIILMAYACFKRKTINDKRLSLFLFILFFFGVMALGPDLHIAGQLVPWVPMPYDWLAGLLPFLKLSGVPVRMMVMVSLCAAVVCAFALKLLLTASARSRVIASMLIVLMVVEYLPSPIPTSNLPIPEWVQVLKNLPGNEGVLDTVSLPSMVLLYQTVHQKPVAFGYVSRLPESLLAKDEELAAVIAREDYDQLWTKYRLRYIVSEDWTRSLRNSSDPKAIIWNDGYIWIFDLSRYTPPR